ncbi:unnamed protein product, partial [Discosporangium mesarthrocarpum]
MIGAESGADMGFDLATDMGARMGAFVDGYRGFTIEESPVLLSVLNDEQLRLLGDMADKSVVHQIQGVATDMALMMESSLKHLPLPAKPWETTDRMFDSVDRYLGPAIRAAEGSFKQLGLSHEQSGIAVGVLSLLSTVAVLRVFVNKFGEDELPIPVEYDLEKLERYYSRKPLQVAWRFIEVSSSFGHLLLNVLADILTDNWDTNMVARARQMREFTSSNGPAFIKVGQGASIRPDILPPVYLAEMQKLQDRVPEFSSKDAREILERELGKPIGRVFRDPSVFDKPIAAASLGQVYKAVLIDTGKVVAVKVQRPNVLATVTRDLYVIRIILQLLGMVQLLRDTSRSVMSLIDSWAVRFIEEMDYNLEARNADRFSREMSAHTVLGNAIKVPKVYHGMTTRYVLVTEWVEGIKASSLERETPQGKARLATLQATLLNSYLVQLLDNGFLHADPHPGNFLIQPDSTLCVLDFGLMTEVTVDQRYALLEYVCHLIAKDYPATLEDLIVLGFISPEVGDDPEKVELVVPLLAKVMEQLSEGGGAQSITIETVGEEVEELARNYPICIPAYFGLIIRCFGSLEGLGLSIDPGYSIVKECFPYLCRRLLTEDSPRMRRMLKSFLYGKEGDYLQVDRVDEIIEGYSTFTALAAEASKTDGMMAQYYSDTTPTTTTSPSMAPAAAAYVPPPPAPVAPTEAGGETVSVPWPPQRFGEEMRTAHEEKGSKTAPTDPSTDPVVMDALRLLFAKEGNYVQDLVVEELARMTDVLGREVNLEFVKILRRVADGVMSPLPLPGGFSFRPTPEAPLNPLLLPIQLPYILVDQVITRVESMLELNKEDRETLKAMRRLMDIFGKLSSRQDCPRNPLTAGAADWQGGASTGTGDEEHELAVSSSLLQSLPRVMQPKKVVGTAQRLAPLLPEIGPGARLMWEKFLRRLAGRVLERIADTVTPEGTAAAEARDLLAEQ